MENTALIVVDVQNGMQTEYCIDTTCKVAFEYGFKLIIPEKTNTTFNNVNLSAKNLYEHYNFNIFNGRFRIVESVDDTVERVTVKNLIIK